MKYEVFGTVLVSLKIEIEAESDMDAIRNAEDIFNRNINTFIDDSSVEFDVVSFNGGIDDAIEVGEDE